MCQARPSGELGRQRRRHRSAPDTTLRSVLLRRFRSTICTRRRLEVPDRSMRDGGDRPEEPKRKWLVRDPNQNDRRSPRHARCAGPAAFSPRRGNPVFAKQPLQPTLGFGPHPGPAARVRVRQNALPPSGELRPVAGEIGWGTTEISAARLGNHGGLRQCHLYEGSDIAHRAPAQPPPPPTL